METLKAIAHPWLCDSMGHMNVRFYTAHFDDASTFFVGNIGAGVDDLNGQGLGWADVRHVVEFKDEVKSGALLVIDTVVRKVGRTSMTFAHTMRSPGGRLHATMEVVSVMFDLSERRSTVIPEFVRKNAQDHLVPVA